VPLGLVLVDDLDRARIDAVLDHFVEPALGQRDHLFFGHSRDAADFFFGERLDIERIPAVAQVCVQDLGKAQRRGVPFFPEVLVP